MASKQPKTSVPYHAHRERQRRRIVDAARRLFDENGIDRVTMAEITAASGVRASTVYQYFSSKDDIVWAITGEVMADGFYEGRKTFEAAPTAYARIASVLDAMASQLSACPEDVRFMAQFDAMYARDWPVERLLNLELKINPTGFGHLSDLVREGIADGSLRPDLDPDLTLHAVLNAAIGAQRRLASLGNKVETEYGQPIDKLFRETIRVVLLGLRATEASVPTGPSKPANSSKSTLKRKVL